MFSEVYVPTSNGIIIYIHTPIYTYSMKHQHCKEFCILKIINSTDVLDNSVLHVVQRSTESAQTTHEAAQTTHEAAFTLAQHF